MRRSIESTIVVLGLTLLPAGGVLGQGFTAPICETVLMAEDAQGEEDYGRVVAAFGDLVAVAAPWDDAAGFSAGSVTIFRHARGAWTEEAVLLPWDGEFEATMGTALDLDGALLAAGAPGAYELGGAVFVFRSNRDYELPAPWSAMQILRPAIPLARESFGAAVALSGDLLVVGAPDAADLDGRTGRVLVHRWNGSSFVFEQEIRPPAGATAFGAVLDVDEHVLVVTDRMAGAGKAYVHRFNGMEWMLAAELQGGSPTIGASFGASVAVEAERIVVGAPEDDLTAFGAGAVYVFESVGATWGLSARLEPSDVHAEHRFGKSVALRDGLLLVGVPEDQDAGWDAGAAYLFALQDGAWTQQRKLLARDPVWLPPYGFGSTIAIGGHDLLIGSLGAAFAQPIDLHPGCDCNGNGQGDWVDVLSGASPDLDANGVPDECQCPADLVLDGTIGNEDLVALLSAWGPCALDCPADLDHDDVVGFSDALLLIGQWGPCP